MKRNLLTIAFLLITMVTFADKGKSKAKTTTGTGTKPSAITFGGGTTKTDLVTH